VLPSLHWRGGPRLVKRPWGGCTWRASPRGKKEGGGGPNGPQDQRTPVAAGPAPLSRMRAMGCSISGGTRRSPHHRCPQAAQGSVDCQRAPRNSVRQGTVAQHSQLVGPRGPSHLHGRLGSEGVPRTRLTEELRARVSYAVKATPSTLGTRTAIGYRLSAIGYRLSAVRHAGPAPPWCPAAADCPASGPRQTPGRSA
jgi:hypothetical protein